MLNKVLLIGNVGMNPEIKVLPSGNSVANFSLATSEYRKDKNGEKKTETEWHRITVYAENLVKLVEKYITKGSKIYIEGSIRTRKYIDTNNIEKTSVEIILRDYNSAIKLLDSKSTTASDISYDKTNQDKQKIEQNQESEEDEIPF